MIPNRTGARAACDHIKQKLFVEQEEGESMDQQNEIGYGSAVPPQAGGAAQETTAQQSRSDMSGMQANVQSSGTPQPSEAAARFVDEEYRGGPGEVSDEIGERVRDFQERADRYVRENPIKAVFAAVGIGFVVGQISRR